MRAKIARLRRLAVPAGVGGVLCFLVAWVSPYRDNEAVLVPLGCVLLVVAAALLGVGAVLAVDARRRKNRPADVSSS